MIGLKMGEENIIKSISNCPIHHHCRQHCLGRKHGPRDSVSLFRTRKGKEGEREREKTEKKHYKLHASPLSVPTTAPPVHVAAKTSELRSALIRIQNQAKGNSVL